MKVIFHIDHITTNSGGISEFWANDSDRTEGIYITTVWPSIRRTWPETNDGVFLEEKKSLKNWQFTVCFEDFPKKIGKRPSQTNCKNSNQNACLKYFRDPSRIPRAVCPQQNCGQALEDPHNLQLRNKNRQNLLNVFDWNPHSHCMHMNGCSVFWSTAEATPCLQILSLVKGLQVGTLLYFLHHDHRHGSSVQIVKKSPFSSTNRSLTVSKSRSYVATPF
jgi:hypothetical protein